MCWCYKNNKLIHVIINKIRCSLEDKCILEGLEKGEAKVFEYIFKKYFKLLVVYAKTYVEDIDLAQDITQDIFVKIYEKRESLSVYTSLKSYLYTSIRNKCFDYLKLEKIHRLHKETIKQTSSEIDEDEDKISEIELQEKIAIAIGKLPEQNQLIFRLSRLEGKTNQEIADTLGLSKRTVETHISNALKKLRILLLITIFLSFLMFFT